MHPSPSPSSKVHPGQLRLRRHADFQAVYRVARKQYAREMSFFFMKRVSPSSPRLAAHLPPPGPRVGLTVGKVLGKAHERNRIKRRLREAVRQHGAVLGDLPVDVVLHPRRSYLSLEWPQLEAEISHILQTVVKLADKPQSPAPPRAKKRAPNKPAVSVKSRS